MDARNPIAHIVAELKRRKLIQIAVLYAVTAWVLLQIAALLLGMLDVPPWGLRLVFVMLIIGFPLAMVLAWLREPAVAPSATTDIRAVAESASAAVSAAPVTADTTPSRTPPALADTVSAPADLSIAVLPFANLSDDKENAYFADGLSEELLNLLARVPGLRVVARTSSFSFRGRSIGVAAIARRLNVSHLIEGSVRKAGSRLRITAQLIRAADSSHVWSHTYDRALSDIFAVQDEIAASVVEELEIQLRGAAAPKSRPTDLRAYDLYLQGQHAFALYSAEGFEQAIGLLSRGIEIDPEFAPAWSVLGSVYWGQANSGLVSFEQGRHQARTASERALALDPTLAEPWSLLGTLDMTDEPGGTAAARHFRRALDLEPFNSRVTARAAWMHLHKGALTPAVALIERTLPRDPLNPNLHAILGLSYYFAGRLTEAETTRRRVLELSPGWLSGRYYLGLVLLARGDARAALETIEQESSESWRRVGCALAHHALGNAAESDAALAALMDRPDGVAFQIAQVHAYRGDVDAAFAWLERAVATHDSGLTHTLVDPLLERLHEDPRWTEFLTRIGVRR